MPRPHPGESEKNYVSRFMGSPEANEDFPDPSQRAAVAHSMWRGKKNSVDAWPKQYSCSFIEPGVVFYQDLGPAGETVLVENDCLEKMAKSFVGKPVIDMEHEDVDSGTVDRGEADGIVTRVWKDEKSGWWMCDFIVWDPACQLHCESLAYSVSCAYEPTQVDSSGGSYHNIDYQQRILDGEYTHLAVVTNPRYEKARIFVNSVKGGAMKLLKFWNKGGRKNAANLDPEKLIDLGDGKKAPLKNLIAAAEAEDKKKEEQMLNDEDIVQMPSGKEKTIKELKDSYMASLHEEEEKKNDAKCMHCDGTGMAKEKDNSHLEGHPEKHQEGKAKLPDLRHADPSRDHTDDALRAAHDRKGDGQFLDNSEDNPDQATEAAKSGAGKTKEPLNLRQSDDKGRLPEELKKAADSFDAKPEGKVLMAEKDEEKKEKENNILEEGETEKKVLAQEKEEKEEKERKNQGKRSFADLKNAASERFTDPVRPVVMKSERLDLGKSRYGKA